MVNEDGFKKWGRGYVSNDGGYTPIRYKTKSEAKKDSKYLQNWLKEKKEGNWSKSMKKANYNPRIIKYPTKTEINKYRKKKGRTHPARNRTPTHKPKYKQ